MTRNTAALPRLVDSYGPNMQAIERALVADGARLDERGFLHVHVDKLEETLRQVVKDAQAPDGSPR